MNKDKLTNICGAIILVAGALIAGDKTGQIDLGANVDGVLSIIVTVGTTLVAYMTGKPNTPPPTAK